MKVQKGLTKVLLQMVGTDVVVIAIAVSQALSILELCIALGMGRTGDSNLFMKLPQVWAPKNRKLCQCSIPLQAVIQFHHFLGKGKKTAWKMWLSYLDVTNAFNLLSDRPESVTDECMNILERLIVLYNRTRPKMKVNEAQKMLFT